MVIKNERGAIMLEAMFSLIVSVGVLLFMLSFGFFLYQKTMVTIVANEVADEVAQTYKLRDVSDGKEVTLSDIAGIGKYRYLFFVNSFDTKNEAKLTTLATTRLSKTSLAQKNGNLTVDVKTVTDDIGRRHYEVTVKQRYTFLLGDLLSVIGQSDVQTLEETVYVESVDVLHYINTVKLSQYLINEVTNFSTFAGLLDSSLEFLKKACTSS